MSQSNTKFKNQKKNYPLIQLFFTQENFKKIAYLFLF